MNALPTRVAGIVVLLAVPMLMAADNAPLTVTVSDVHLCCKGCTSAVEKSVADIEGIKCTTSQDDGTIVLTGNNPKDIQKAIDAIAAAGFCGKPDNEEVQFKPIEFKEDNVRRLEVAHIHNCCKMCTDAIQGAIESVPGVSSNTVKNKQVSFVVEGEFSPAEVVKAIQEAGFYPTIKGREEKQN